MRNYVIYFELCGKKMKTTIVAENPEQAKEAIKHKIIFHKVEKKKDEFNNIMEMMDDAKNLFKK